MTNDIDREHELDMYLNDYDNLPEESSDDYVIIALCNNCGDYFSEEQLDELCEEQGLTKGDEAKCSCGYELEY